MSVVDFDPNLDEVWTDWFESRDPVARDRLLIHYSPLVKFVAGRLGAGLPSSVDPGDLVGAGVFGLMDALERFDENRGVKFETFAGPRIRGAIYDSLRKLDWVPRSVRSRARQVEQAIAQLEQQLDRSPTDVELAEALRISEAELAKWLSSISSTTIGPLDRLIEVGYEPSSQTPEGLDTPDAAIERVELSNILRDSIAHLPERERFVLGLYYDEGLTLAEIGEILGVTESRVSQIHTKSILVLRSRMKAAGAT